MQTAQLTGIMLIVAGAMFTALASVAASDTASSVNPTARMVCARCHEVGTRTIPGRKLGDGTPPPFVMIAQDPKMTPEALRRYIRFPHGAMDTVFITQREADALVAYIQSLKPAPQPQPVAP